MGALLTGCFPTIERPVLLGAGVHAATLERRALVAYRLNGGVPINGSYATVAYRNLPDRKRPPQVIPNNSPSVHPPAIPDISDYADYEITVQITVMVWTALQPGN